MSCRLVWTAPAVWFTLVGTGAHAAEPVAQPEVSPTRPPGPSLLVAFTAPPASGPLADPADPIRARLPFMNWCATLQPALLAHGFGSVRCVVDDADVAAFRTVAVDYLEPLDILDYPLPRRVRPLRLPPGKSAPRGPTEDWLLFLDERYVYLGSVCRGGFGVDAATANGRVTWWDNRKHRVADTVVRESEVPLWGDTDGAIAGAFLQQVMGPDPEHVKLPSDAHDADAATFPLAVFKLDSQQVGAYTPSQKLGNGWVASRTRCVFPTACATIVMAAQRGDETALVLAQRPAGGSDATRYVAIDQVDLGKLAGDQWLSPGNTWTVAAAQKQEPCNRQFAALFRRGERSLTPLRAWEVIDERLVEVEAATVTFTDECGA